MGSSLLCLLLRLEQLIEAIGEILLHHAPCYGRRVQRPYVLRHLISHRFLSVEEVRQRCGYLLLRRQIWKL